MLLQNRSSQLLVIDSNYSGVWLAPKVEEAYILDVDEVGNLSQTSVQIVALTAHHLFDQMILRLQRKTKQWKHIKSWMFKYKKQMCDSGFKNWWETKRSFLDRCTSVKHCSQPEVMMKAKLVSRACISRLSDLFRENAEKGEKQMQRKIKQDKLLKSWRFKFRGVMETIRRTYEDAVRVLEILQAILEGLQFDLMSFEANNELVFLSFVLRRMVEDNLQHLCTEMWLMGTARWRCDYTERLRAYYDEHMMFTGNVGMENMTETVIDLADRLQKSDVELTSLSWKEHEIQSSGSQVWHRWKNKIEERKAVSCILQWLVLSFWFRGNGESLEKIQSDLEGVKVMLTNSITVQGQMFQAQDNLLKKRKKQHRFLKDWNFKYKRA